MGKTMLSRKTAIQSIFDLHGSEAVYITNTGYNSRAVYDMYPANKNILYMQGSMGLSPAIALGIASNTEKDVVAFVGDASLLMHLGITQIIQKYGIDILMSINTLHLNRLYGLVRLLGRSAGGCPIGNLRRLASRPALIEAGITTGRGHLDKKHPPEKCPSMQLLFVSGMEPA